MRYCYIVHNDIHAIFAIRTVYSDGLRPGSECVSCLFMISVCKNTKKSSRFLICVQSTLRGTCNVYCLCLNYFRTNIHSAIVKLVPKGLFCKETQDLCWNWPSKWLVHKCSWQYLQWLICFTSPQRWIIAEYGKGPIDKVDTCVQSFLKNSLMYI